MLVEEIMNEDPVYLHAGDSIEKALKYIDQHKIRHIPIVDENHILTGIVSDRDIRDASPSIFHTRSQEEHLKKAVSRIMSVPVITANPLDVVEDAAVVLYNNGISSLPVTGDHDNLLGMVTESTVLHTLVELTGAHQPSSRIEVKANDRPGELAAVTSIFHRKQMNVISVLVYPGRDDVSKYLAFRVQTMDPRDVIHDLKEAGYEVSWPRIPGLNE
ncbi:acetoin utilization AcuB family protein [Salibacterium halotolerans]|uniref:Acetoin utilization protein AcuB n=1 Tax=Salibacterium halotolerans TaxID=1884432 RepID=A0A1I5VJU4_9BACI|nr:acetoin utilization AcuB family protein [Salibacterium halotolerans]SFQ07701.1 acetoin utilization protein AcuB [Salibacterium halotolerans]